VTPDSREQASNLGQRGLVFVCAGDVSPYARGVVLGVVAYRSGTCCGYERQRVAGVDRQWPWFWIELREYISAQSSGLNCWAVGGLGACVCGAQVGNPRGERRWTTAVLQPGAVGMVVQRTEAAKQSHGAAEKLG
jgi:hypothetical protein